MACFYRSYHAMPKMQLNRKSDNLPTGALYDDVIVEALHQFETRRETLYQELNLCPDQPMILCALPPLTLSPH